MVVKAEFLSCWMFVLSVTAARGQELIPPLFFTCPGDISLSTLPVEAVGLPVAVPWTEPTYGEDGGAQASRTHSPGDEFRVGNPTNVSYTIVDNAGNTATCEFSISLQVDTTRPPIPECTGIVAPSVVIVVVELGSTSEKTVVFDGPTSPASQGSNSLPVISTNCNSGDQYPVGETSCTFISVDPSGNTYQCDFIVLVLSVDTTPPTISDCPDTLTVTIELGAISRSVIWLEPTATDLSNTVKLMTHSHVPGDTFLLGSTMVTYLFVDESMNSAVCRFSVVVNTADTVPPVVIGCPETITAETELGSTGTQVIWGELRAIDLSGVATLISRSHAPGDFFSLGSTTVTYLFSDSSGNTATCSFLISVRLANTTQMVCPRRAILTEATGPFTGVKLPGLQLGKEETPSMERFGVGVTRIVRRSGIENCHYSVIVEDTTPPEVTMCDNDVTAHFKPSDPGDRLTPISWRVPAAVDNATSEIAVQSSDDPADLFPVGITTVRYTFCDSSDNTADCIFRVNILEDKEPENDVITKLATCQKFTQVVPVNEIQDTYNVTVALSSNTETRTSTPPSTSVERTFLAVLGYQEIIYNFTNTDGQSDVCRLKISVAVANTMQSKGLFESCPLDIVLSSPSSSNFTHVTWREPILNASGFTVSSSHFNGDIFYVGRTTVTYTAEADGVMTDKCEFVVVIIDDTPPEVFNCPPDITVSVCRGPRTVHWFEPQATDNSGVEPVNGSHTHLPNNSKFGIGTTRVSYIFRDDSRNVATCRFDVTVRKSVECETLSPGVLIVILVFFLMTCSIILISCRLCLRCIDDTKEDRDGSAGDDGVDLDRI